MDAERKKYEAGMVDDQGTEHVIDEFDLSVFAYGWCVKQDRHTYYKDRSTGLRYEFKNRRLIVDLF